MLSFVAGRCSWAEWRPFYRRGSVLGMQESREVALPRRPSAPPASELTSALQTQETLDEPGPVSLPSYDQLRPLRPGHWRVHDRTHLELLVDYPVVEYQRQQGYVWEAYFFLPQSLRLDSTSYPKTDIYRDFQSYVRFAAKEPALDRLCLIPRERLEPVLEVEAELTREARLFGCQFRVAAMRSRERLLRRIALGSCTSPCAELDALSAALHRAIEEYRGVSSMATRPAAIRALRHVDEDMCRVHEEVFASLCSAWREAGDEVNAKAAEADAVAAARQRLEPAGLATASVRHRDAVDESEFRRHALKRYTSSVLWLARTISDAGALVRQLLFALAASVAMTFAVVAAFYSGGPQVNTRPDNLLAWVLLVVVAYATKDRIKASLQGVFAEWTSRRFADRRWRLDAQGLRRLGVVEERSRFVGETSIPHAVRDLHVLHKVHDIENVAHPERVLWHHKHVVLRSAEIAAYEPRFGAVTEVFRLDVSRWLAHTDDPKQRVHLADVARNAVYTVLARRIYHVDVIYRTRRSDDDAAPWCHCRVVLNRNGIRSAQSRT